MLHLRPISCQTHTPNICSSIYVLLPNNTNPTNKSVSMRPSTRLLNACRITLFTRPNCSLCDDAKAVLSTVWDKRPFDFSEVKVMTPGQEAWKKVYEFDTPVVCSNPVPKTLNSRRSCRSTSTKLSDVRLPRILSKPCIGSVPSKSTN